MRKYFSPTPPPRHLFRSLFRSLFRNPDFGINSPSRGQQQLPSAVFAGTVSLQTELSHLICITHFQYLWRIKPHRHFYESINGGEPTCIDDDIPFEIPDSWEWCRCSTLINLQSGQDLTPDKYNDEKKGVPYITGASNVKLGEVIINRWTEYPKSLAFAEDILISCKGTVGELAILKEPTVHIARQIMAIRIIVLSLQGYLYLFWLNQVDRLREKQQGLIPGISRENILDTLIPLPPAHEQKRICSAIAIKNKELRRILISRSLYKRILSETPTSIRQQLIQAAVQGQLVPQNPNDEPASALLERIAQERSAKLGKKAAKSMSRIERRGSKTHATYREIFPDGSEKDISEEIPFDVPDGWEWVRAGAIFDIWSAKRVLQSDWQTAGIPFYRAREIAKLAEFGQVNNDLFIKEELFQRLAIGGLPHTGDLMITAVGTIGKVYIVKQEDRFYFKDASVISFRNSGGLNSSFLKKLLESDCLQEQMYNKSAGTTVDTITIAKANEYLLPIPPLAEQNRISERLEKLLSKIE